MMKKQFIFFLLLVLVLPAAYAVAPQQMITVKGEVTCNGKGIANVPVTDGVSVVVTDARGRYVLNTFSDRKHVYYTLPSGYESPIAAGVPVFYKALSAAKNQQINFELLKAEVSQDSHAFIAWADPQVLEMEEFEQLRQVVGDLNNTARTLGQIPIHAISLGDEVFDRPLLFDTYKKTIAETGLRFYQVMGNHDMDYNKRSEELSTVTFGEKFGPAWYSFNKGKVHYVVLKDVFYYGYSYRYIGYITETQLQWLEQDLAHVKPGSTLIVGLHIPTVHAGQERMSIPSSGAVMNNEALFKILEPFNTHILAGHSHTQWNTVISSRLFEHVHAASSGAWWQGEVSVDGSPKGYTVYMVNGDSLSWYFKGVNLSSDDQFKVYPLGSNSMYSDCILANVYNYDPAWEVSWYENGKYMGHMQQYWGFDPQASDLYQPGKNKKHSWLSADQTNHLFKAPVNDPSAKITIEVKDRFGKIYRKELEPQKAKGTKSDGWKLVWKEEFSNTGLPDSTRWNFDTHGNSYGWGNNELQWYTDKNPKNATVSDGTLKITARREPTSGKAYSSARITTRKKGDWLYGKVEVRAKLPLGRGTWPAIWMLPTESNYGGWPHSGEIDIMEHVGYNPGVVHSTVHTGAYNHVKGTQVGKPVEVITAMNDFHVYTTEWDENEISSYVDGKLYFTFKNERKTSEEWPFDKPFHLILNVAIGGGWGGQKGVDDTIFPTTMEVDYVRIYQK